MRGVARGGRGWRQQTWGLGVGGGWDPAGCPGQKGRVLDGVRGRDRGRGRKVPGGRAWGWGGRRDTRRAEKGREADPERASERASAGMPTCPPFPGVCARPAAASPGSGVRLATLFSQWLEWVQIYSLPLPPQALSRPSSGHLGVCSLLSAPRSGLSRPHPGETLSPVAIPRLGWGLQVMRKMGIVLKRCDPRMS